MIAGFCTETEEDHQDTLSMMDFAQYSMSYMFFYSERPGTLAERKYEDDVPLEVKKRRLSEIIKKQSEISLRSEEHTSELQSRGHLVCRLLLEKKKEAARVQ